MLDEINKPNWKVLGYPAMAEWLIGISSEDELIRKKAYDNLYDNHASHLSPASPYLIPCLIAFLRVHQVPDKDNIILLLLQLTSHAYSYKIDKTFSDIVKRVLDEVSKGSSLYLNYLRQGEATGMLLEVFFYLGEYAGNLLPDLYTMANLEKNNHIKALYFPVIGNLISLIDDQEIKGDYERKLREAILLEQDDAVRFAISAAIAKISESYVGG